MKPADTPVIPTGFGGVEKVVAESLKFKARLGIGEDAYNSLTAGRTLAEFWHFATSAATGGAVASSAVIAKTFFGTWATSWGLATAVTPAGWILGAAAASGVLGWGVLRLWRNYNGARVEVVPKFINTPLDFLGAALFDLMAGLAILVAREAEDLDETEREVIRDYFVSLWGLDAAYVAAALPLIEDNMQGKKIEDVVAVLVAFKRQNKDCNYTSMTRGLLEFLQEIAEADNEVNPREAAAIAHVRRALHKGEPWSLKRGLRLVLTPLRK